MKTMNKTVLAGSLLVISGIATAGEQPFSISANVAMTTDYVFRGVTQTSEDPALQGGFDINHESGFYVGTWGSNINYGGGDPAHLEIDYYAGFANELSNGLSYDLAYLYYTYPGVDGNLKYDFGEFKLGLGYEMFSAEYYYANHSFGGGGKAHYFSLDADFELGQGFSGGLHVGRQNFDDATSVDYTDWSVSVGKSVMGVDLSLAYTDTDQDNAENIADGRVVFMISKSF